MTLVNSMAVAALAGAVILPLQVHAETYPARAVTLIVPFTPGGGSDAVARVVAKKLAEDMGVPFIVDNKGGAGTNIGNEAAARARPDGYTLLLGQVTLGINPSLYPKLSYNVRDLTPISMVATSPTVLVVTPSLPVRTVDDLVKLAKSRPGTLNFGSGGHGTSVHLAGELFKSTTGVQIVHVPYKGSAPAVSDLIGGQIQMMFDTAASAVPRVKGGQLRALAVTGAKRLPELPDVPTFAESGFKGFDAPAWYGVMGPPGLPRDIVVKLNGEIAKALNDPVTRKSLQNLGTEPGAGTPEQLGSYLASEIDKWGNVIRSANIKLE